MRYDEIDLNGIITIQGIKGGDKNLVQYSGGLVSWVTASVPTAINSLEKNIGKNFRIVESVSGDSYASGFNFQNAYNSFLSEVATLNLSETNRYTFLFMPGTYDIPTMTIGQSFIDIVGMSSNPRSTKIRGSITLSVSSIKIKNFHIDASSTFNIGSNFVEAENLIVVQNTIVSTDLRGVFRKIRVLPGGSFGNASNSIDAIFDDIYFEGTSVASFNAASGGMIQGTFSNITFENIGENTFYHNNQSNFDCKINFYNFKVWDANATFFTLYGTVSGTYENVDIRSSSSVIVGYTIKGKWKNIKIRNTGNNYVFSGSAYDVDIENLDINTDPPTGFFDTGFGPLHGTFSNVKINLGGNAFQCFSSPDIRVNINNFSLSGADPGYFFSPLSPGSTISGNFQNMEIETISTGFSPFASCNLIGNFENITVKSVTGNLFFVAAGKIQANFKNIELLNCSNSSYCLGSSGGVEGEFENILNTNLPGERCSGIFNSNNFISGNFKNLNLNANSVFQSSNTMSCVVMDSYFDTSSLFTSNTNIVGTYSNIVVASPTISDSFYSSSGFINVNVKKLYLKDITSKLFWSSGNLSGTYKNIRFRDHTSTDLDASIFKGNNILGNFSDIICGSGSGYFIFESNNIINGTFSNIRIGTGWQKYFVSNSEIGGNFKDLYLPNSLGNVAFDSSTIMLNSKFDNVLNYNLFGSIFRGVMSNCTMVNPNRTTLEGNYQPLEVDFTSPVVIENSDFYYYGSIEIPSGFSSYFVFGDIFPNPQFTVTDAHILNCGLSIGLPLATNGFVPSNCGIDPILGVTNSINYIGSPLPK